MALGQFGRQELKQALKASRGLLVGVALFSALVNLLMLTGPLFMLQVYDRVLASGSEETLATLFALVATLFLFMGLLDHARTRVLSRAGAKFQSILDIRVFRAVLHRGLLPGERGRPASGLKDLEAIQRALSGPGPFGFLDLPWVPFFLLIIFLFHWWLGVFALVGGITLVIIALFNQRRSRMPLAQAANIGSQSEAYAEAIRREAEVVHGLGMQSAVLNRWKTLRDQTLQAQINASDAGGAFTVSSKTLRLFLQSAILALGALLAVRGHISPGMMIAASILMGRALAPVDQVIAHWSTMARAVQGWRSLADMLQRTPPSVERIALPSPEGRIEVENIIARPPGTIHPTIRGVSFALMPGQALGVIGPSGSGKTTLAKVLLGLWPPLSGVVRLDGAAVDQYDADVLGRHLGYLPQDVTLFDGTVAENIARFDPEATDAAIVAAAQRAGAHDLILGLSDGYETQVGPNGASISGGQRQRVGLARAFYRDPVLLVLDEPNAHLDMVGEQALAHAIEAQRERGGIAVVMAHRPGAIMACDQLMMLDQGQVRALGPRDDVLQATTQNFPKIVAQKPAE
ncbi:MAG: type I secretion system permease/ATPase [Puniceicoccaceae bacterium]|nr:MAG: type I secretion system permease/ATPase [Puniceicoccaceae bacterium]